MENDILYRVIEVERDIYMRISLEKERADALINKANEASEEDLLRDDERLKADIKTAVDEAKADAEKRAVEIISSARMFSERLSSISDDELKEIMAGHIRRILPVVK
jgi:vacuolar-type H+-ATPase subunit H